MNSQQMTLMGALVIMSIILSVQNIPFLSVEANKPPKLGNPHDFRTGPPIPSCSADFHQGPPDDELKGCRDTKN
jgi:hypothetical protein